MAEPYASPDQMVPVTSTTYFGTVAMCDATGFTISKHPPLILVPAAPLDSAREMVRRRYDGPLGRTLHHQSGEFLHWNGTHYVEIEIEQMRSEVYHFLDGAKCSRNDELVPYNPNRGKVANFMEALAAAVQIQRGIQAPAWLDQQIHPPANEILGCANGLLHLPTRTMHPHTPAFLIRNALTFDFTPDASEPAAWLQFLYTLWPNDAAAIDVLQEMFGLLLTGETRHQKAFLLVGPKRSGKGTIARVLTQLLGQESVCGPTLSSLGSNFGIAPLIGKRLAVISEARLGGRTDQQVIVERLLAITGEDSLTVDRKFRDAWTGRLNTRFLILTNELPRLSDTSGAMAGRFIILVLQNSFFGKEDHGLTDRLVRELPGILCWALEGWDRLQARGHFVPPDSSKAAQQDLEDLGSPIGAFLRDRCEVNPTAAEACDQTYKRWCDWCEAQGRTHPGTVQTFGRDLRAAVPGLTTIQPRDDRTGRQERRYYQGLGMKL
jgi:putative DNA primase/helicase